MIYNQEQYLVNTASSKPMVADEAGMKEPTWAMMHSRATCGNERFLSASSCDNMTL